MSIADCVNTFGNAIRHRYGGRAHKLAIDAALSCPNRDGGKGGGGRRFRNSSSFGADGRNSPDLFRQLAAGRDVIRGRTRAMPYAHRESS